LGARLIGRDQVLQPSCRYFPTPLRLFLGHAGLNRFAPLTMRIDDLQWPHDTQRECDWVPGCYYLMRRAVYQTIGLFDPRYFLYYEEVDHCRLAKNAGWKVYFCPDTTVVHIGGESAKTQAALTQGGRQISALQVESELLYLRKFHGATGLVGHFVLHMIGNLILLAKAAFKWRLLAVLRDITAESQLRWQLAHKTRFGCVPTR
jgi:GT2 family glycosyltransferase